MNVQAVVARLAGVLGPDGNQLDTAEGGLVRQKQAKLVEGPMIGPSPFRFTMGRLVGSFPDAGQVLNRNRGAFLFGRSDDLGADVVV